MHCSITVKTGLHRLAQAGFSAFGTKEAASRQRSASKISRKANSAVR